MTNILIEGYDRIPSFILFANEFEQLSSDLNVNVRCKLSRNINSSDLSWCDILICVRANNPLSTIIAEKAFKSGRKVILSLDDDLMIYHYPEFSFLNEWYKKSLLTVMSYSSIMMTTSKYLGEKYNQEYGINFVLNDTTVEESEIKKIHHDGKTVKMLYAAGNGHKTFFDALIRPILNRLYCCFGDNLTLTVIGPNIDTDGINLPIKKIDSMPLDDYNDYMKHNDFDIGLAPLLDFELGRSKYFNKYLEYTRNMMCGIYSRVLPYTLVVKNEYNGILVDNTPEDWYESIRKAVSDYDLRNKCVSNAYSQVLSEYNRENNIKKIITGIPYINTYKVNSSVKADCSFMYIRFLLFELLRRFLKKVYTVFDF